MINAKLEAKDLIDDYKKKAIKFPRAVNSAINKITTQTRNYIIKDLLTVYNIKSPDLKKSFSIRKSNWKTLTAKIDAYGKGISFTRFGTKFPSKQTKGPSGKRRYVVKVKIMKSKPPSVASNVFMIPNKKTFFRERGGKVEKAYAVGPAQMFNDKIKNKADIFIRQNFPAILEHDIDFFYN